MVFECFQIYVFLVKFHVSLTPDKNRCAEMYSGSFSFSQNIRMLFEK